MKLMIGTLILVDHVVFEVLEFLVDIPVVFGDLLYIVDVFAVFGCLQNLFLDAVFGVLLIV